MRDAPFRSEDDLLVFISSVMKDEMETARNTVVETCSLYPLTRPWAFEFTPSSSETPSKGYLRKVREADFVIWLIGGETTQPVVDEVTTCMTAGRRLLAFMLPSEFRSEVTEDLISQVSAYAKWAEVARIDDLAQHVRAALSDELVKALRDPDPPNRALALTEMKQLSLARCKRMWTSLGVPNDLATELAEDQTVGDLLEFPDSGVLRVEGDQGAGKTLAAERLLQKAIDRALRDSSQPFPVFVSARDLRTTIQEFVEQKSRGLSRPSSQGTLIIVDGLDEIGIHAANSRLDELSIISDTLPKTSAVVSIRPLPGLKDTVGENQEMPTLNEQACMDLIGRISQRKLTRYDWNSWSESVREAAKKPLFAIMIGSVLRDNPGSSFYLPVQLIAELAKRTLSEVENPVEVDSLLQRLAVEAVNSGKRIPTYDLTPRQAEQRMLANSRLVMEQEGMVDFTLSIFREWYAARALVEQTISFEDVSSDTDNWVVPLAIAVTSEIEHLGHSLMEKMCSSDPGLASLVLQEIDFGWYPEQSDGFSLGPAKVEGEKIRRAMDSWGQGLGPLYQVIGPTDSQGNTSTLGIRVKDYGDGIDTTWYKGMQELSDIVDLRQYVDWSIDNPEWSGLVFRRVLHSKMWPWIITKEDLSNSLFRDTYFEHLALEPNSTDTIRECCWAFALGVQGQSHINQKPIDIGQILQYIEEQTINVVSLRFPDGGYYLNKHIRIIKQHLQDSIQSGKLHIADPWPAADQVKFRSGPIWECYSPKRLLDRTSEVYAGALRVYETLVQEWFSSFAPRLQMHSLLPVRLEGRLRIPEGQGNILAGPDLTWVPSKLAPTENSVVDFSLGESKRLYEGFREGLYPFHVNQGLDVYGLMPATQLACTWLRGELEDLDWGR